MLVPKLVTVLRDYNRSQFTADLTAGVIVGIVALPLAIAFAIASGVSPERGLITAIIGGFLISALGGSRVQIGGPTGAFVVIVYGVVQEFGVEGLMIATFMAEQSDNAVNRAKAARAGHFASRVEAKRHGNLDRSVSRRREIVAKCHENLGEGRPADFLAALARLAALGRDQACVFENLQVGRDCRLRQSQLVRDLVHVLLFPAPQMFEDGNANFARQPPDHVGTLQGVDYQDFATHAGSIERGYA
jgi:hypothetical protein